MSSGKNSKVLLGSGLLLAATSSLCCIVPLLAIIGGAGSVVSAFSWASPLRPYLLGATLLVLGFAFHQVYKPRKKDACGCAEGEKKGLLQSKAFVWGIAGVSILLSTFPYYATYFQAKTPKPPIVVNNSAAFQQVVFHIEGMSCATCEGHVNKALLGKKGVQEVNTSYAKKISTVRFDSTRISLQQLAAAIESETGYKVNL